MKRDITVYLEDILGSIELIEEYTNNLNYEETDYTIDPDLIGVDTKLVIL